MAKLAIVFPGQGAQYSGMAEDLYQASAAARDVFHNASAALNYDLAELCFKGSEEELMLTEKTQPAILAHSLAAWSIVRDLLPENSVQAMAGLSLGEYSALVASGVLPLGETFAIVKERGKAMQHAVPAHVGSMAAILGLDVAVLENTISRLSTPGCIVEVANYNSPGQVVISGHAEAVDKAIDALKEAGAARAVKLAVSAPFHCSLLQPAAERLSEVMEPVVIDEFTWPVIANVNAQAYASKEMVKELLIKQVTNSVRWEQTIKYLLTEGFDAFLELGPGKTLSQFIRRTAKDAGVPVQIASLDKMSELAELQDFLVANSLCK